MTRQQAKPWSADELATLRTLYPDRSSGAIALLLGRAPGSVYQKAASLGIKKSAAFFASDEAGRIQRGHQHPNIVANRFQPGIVPWNTGRIGWSAPNSEATRFKPGSAPPNRQDVGALRINSDGQLDIKLFDGLRGWVQLSHYNWFLAHGEWPARGMCLRFRDGDVHNPAIGNLELLTRRENMRRNSVHTLYPPEVAQLVQLRGALHRQINLLSKQPPHQDMP